MSHLRCLNPHGTDTFSSCPSRCHPHCRYALRVTVHCHLCGRVSRYRFTDELMRESHLYDEALDYWVRSGGVGEMDTQPPERCRNPRCAVNCVVGGGGEEEEEGGIEQQQEQEQKGDNKAEEEEEEKEEEQPKPLTLPPDFPFDSYDFAPAENMPKPPKLHDYVNCELCEQGRSLWERRWRCWACDNENHLCTMEGMSEPATTNRWCQKCKRERDAACVRYWIPSPSEVRAY